MDIRSISPYPEHCTVTLDVPWEVAEALVSSGPALIAKLRDAIKHEKQRVGADEKLNQHRNQTANTPLQEWQALAAPADKRIRHLVEAENLPFSKAVSITAKEFHFPPSSLHALIASYRKQVKEETTQSRDVEIIRLYFRGLSNRVIGEQLGISPRTVQRVLGDHADIVKFVRNLPATNEAEPKRETREEKKQRLFRRNAEILERHIQGTSTVKLAKKFNLTSQTIQRIIRTCDKPTSVLNREQLYKKRKDHHRRLGVQIYRHYRRIRPDFDDARQAHKVLADRFNAQFDDAYELSHIYVEYLIQVRRKKIKQYIRVRKLKTIVRLRENGHKFPSIAAQVNSHEKTVARILRKHKASQIQGEAS